MADISKWTTNHVSDLETLQRRLHSALLEISQACQRRVATSKTGDDMDPIVSITIDHSGRGKLSIARYYDDHACVTETSFDGAHELAMRVIGPREVPQVPYVDPKTN